jgi:hypothetical protein
LDIIAVTVMSLLSHLYDSVTCLREFIKLHSPYFCLYLLGYLYETPQMSINFHYSILFQLLSYLSFPVLMKLRANLILMTL